MFSGQISSDQLFYPVVSELNFDAILYPSVQRKEYGWNVAIRNELILEHYDLIGVETRFILHEYTDLDYTSEEVATDQIIGSFGTEAFDFDNGKILYSMTKKDQTNYLSYLGKCKLEKENKFVMSRKACLKI